MTAPQKTKILLVGWDAADWKLIHPLLDAGQMPTLQRIIENGVMGNLSTLEPPLSPMVWTSIATGMLADKHGIHGFTEPNPHGGGVRPVSSTSRRVKAIWNILTQNNFKTHVVGWWPSHPAEPINGVCISNHYQHAGAPRSKAWPVIPGTVHPSNMSELFGWLRVHPEELTQAHLLPVIPLADQVDQEQDKRLSSYGKILAECGSIQSAATWILENEPWDFMAVYFDGIDHFCHAFMPFHPPRMDHVPQELFDIYSGVVSGAYRFHDMMLARLVELAGPDTTVILISDHGFHSDHLRPTRTPKEPAGPAHHHRTQGIFCMQGPGIKKDELIHGASVLDIAPTVLSLFNLPVGRDMDGKVLLQALEATAVPNPIPSWEKISGACGMHPDDMVEDPYVAREALEQMIAMGYIEDPGPDAQGAVERCKRESHYNLARVYQNSDRLELALKLFKELYTADPTASRFALSYARCCLRLNHLQECQRVLKNFNDYCRAQIVAEEALRRANKEKTTSSENDAERKEQVKRMENIRQVRVDLVALELLKADLLLKENRPKRALKIYQSVENKGPKRKWLYLQIGNSYYQLKQYTEAEKAFLNAIEKDPDSPEAHHGLAKCCLRTGRFEDAVNAALEAVGLDYNSVFAHYHLAESLYHLGEHAQAAQAFQVCLSMEPGVSKARDYLIKIYEKHLDRPDLAAEHRAFFENRDRPLIVVVSGLPRSGTSMMMQSLEAGGLPVFIDEKRAADDSNPRGYFEHTAVKRLARDKSWVGDAEGHAVKVVAHLLFHLPARYNYKVICMRRDFEEVISSQQKLLNQLGEKSRTVSTESLLTNYGNTMTRVDRWARESNFVEMLDVEFSSMIDDPLFEAEKLSNFLGGELDSDRMAAVVDAKLHTVKKN